MNENTYGKLKYGGSMIDYVYGSETPQIWWRNKWTAPKAKPLWLQIAGLLDLSGV